MTLIILLYFHGYFILKLLFNNYIWLLNYIDLNVLIKSLRTHLILKLLIFYLIITFHCMNFYTLITSLRDIKKNLIYNSNQRRIAILRKNCLFTLH